MSFTWLGTGTFAAGLVGLAALLYALQRLRVRHREVTVVTTLFWHEAIEETRARVFVQRFRHPWAYALVLAIASLAWLAVAGPKGASAAQREHVIVVDASAGMARGTRFDDALRAAGERAGELPRGSTRVLLAGARVEVVLDRGEALPLFDARTTGRRPDACPASVQRALFDLLRAERPRAGLALELYGDAPIDAAMLARLPADVELVRADCGAPPSVPNAGIVALGVTDAASGAWDAVDLYCEVAADRACDVVLTLDGAVREFDRRETAADRIRLGARDLPAAGGRVELRVEPGDGLALDDRASIVLPVRPPIRVALSGSVPGLVRSALEVDPGVALVDSDPDVVVRSSGEDFGGEAPALELADDVAQEPAFVVRRTQVRDPERELRSSFEGLGLAEIDSTELAEVAARPITLTLEVAERRGVSLWATLLEARFDFAQSRAFPMFLARAVRWLSGGTEFGYEVAAGEPLRDGTASLQPERGATLDALGRELRVPHAGAWRSGDGRPVQASLLDAGVTLGATDDALERAEPAAVAGGEWLPWIVLLAIALLALEWWLVRTERMP